MYRLTDPIWYPWSIFEENAYVLPYFKVNERGKIQLKFLELLDSQLHLRGTLSADAITRHSKSSLCRQIQDSHSEWEYLEHEQLIGLDLGDSEEDPSE